MMKMFEQYFGQWVVAKRWWILLVSAVLSVCAVYGAQFLSFENDNRIFFSEDNPQLKAFEALERDRLQGQVFRDRIEDF